MSKKILSILLALVMVLAIVPVSVFAQDEEANGTYYESGGFFFYVTDVHVFETVEVTIGTDFDSFECGSLQINFDPEYLEHDEDLLYENNINNLWVRGGIPFDCTNEDGILNVGILHSRTLTGTEKFITLEFKVLKAGSSTLTVSTNHWDADTTPANASITISYNDNIDEVLSCLTYEINDGEAIITDCDESISGDVVIPNTIEGYPVTSIGDHAFYNCKSLTNITIPNSVISIGNSAFEYCTSLASITIPDSVTSIGDHAFSWCESLASITIPDSVTSISDDAFAYCKSLISITIPDSVTSIGESAFEGCTGLTNITIPDSVTSIGSFAFFGCKSLASITIPDSVISIDSSAFYRCESLTNIEIPNSVTLIGDYAFGYYFVDLIYYYVLLDGFTIYGYTGSAAETYANENGIKFVDINSEEYIPDEPITDEPITDEPITDEPVTDEPVTDEPTTDEPVTDEPTTDKPVQNTSSNVLIPNADSNITITDAVATLTPEMSVADVIKSVENENLQILNKDGEVVASDEFVGTGSKVQVLDNDGNVLSEYEVMVKSDVDGNGKITPADARLALRASANLDKLEGVYETAANYDGEKTVSTSDARMILRKAAGLE